MTQFFNRSVLRKFIQNLDFFWKLNIKVCAQNEKKTHITRLNGTNIFEFDLVNLFGSELYQLTIVAQVGNMAPGPLV